MEDRKACSVTSQPAKARNASGTTRNRTYYGYSRTGCSRCKQLRVRCDEKHPECDRCVRAGTKCPGFEQTLRWSTKHEVFCPGQGGKGVSKTRAQASTGPRQTAPIAARRGALATPAGLEKLQADIQAELQGGRKRRAENSQNKAPASTEATTGQGDLAELLGVNTSFDSSSNDNTANNSNINLAGLAWPNPSGGQTLVDTSSFDNFLMELTNFGPTNQKPMRTTELDPAPFPFQSLMSSNQSSGSMLGNSSMALATTTTDMLEVMPQQFLFPCTGDMRELSFSSGSPTASPPGSSSDSHSPPFLFYPYQDTATVGGEDRSTDVVSLARAFTVGSPVAEKEAYFPKYASPTTKSLNDIGTVLLEFYFKETCQVYSCYDSRLNPFRTAVVRQWNSSRLIYCTIQSMAAGCLVRDFPQVATIGKQMRHEAIQILSETTKWDVDKLFVALMLGGTSSWHDSHDLGLPLFNHVVDCLANEPASTFGSGEEHQSYQFFHESMLYWEMLLAFVADNDGVRPVPRPHSLPPGANVMQKRSALEKQRAGPAPPQHMPHPWTGFAADTHWAVQKVGRLIRRQRKFDYAHRFASMAHINQLKRDMDTARGLEEYLAKIVHPTEQSVKDPEDQNTPVWHLLTLAEAIRNIGLIQLYHVFPDLLSARLRREKKAAAAAGSGLASRGTGPYDGDKNTGSRSKRDRDETTPQERRKWLTAYALQTVNLIKSLPLESGTRDFQPFLLCALCSELRIDPRSRAGAAAGGGGEAAGDPSLLSIDMETVEVKRARGFVESRMASFLHILPQKPMLVCQDIVKTTWEQMDRQAEDRLRFGGDGWENVEGEADVYWMDVMIENGWETIMA